MPVVNVHRYVVAGEQTGGTFVVTGQLDVTAGLTFYKLKRWRKQEVF